MTYEHVDVGRISVLTHELQNDLSASLRFVDDFIAAWPVRRERLITASASPIIDDCLVVMLTLITSGSMVGALTLSAAAKELYTESRSLGRVSTLDVERIVRIGDFACLELRSATESWRSGIAG